MIPPPSPSTPPPLSAPTPPSSSPPPPPPSSSAESLSHDASGSDRLPRAVSGDINTAFDTRSKVVEAALDEVLATSERRSPPPGAGRMRETRLWFVGREPSSGSLWALIHRTIRSSASELAASVGSTVGVPSAVSAVGRARGAAASSVEPSTATSAHEPSPSPSPSPPPSSGSGGGEAELARAELAVRSHALRRASSPATRGRRRPGAAISRHDDRVRHPRSSRRDACILNLSTHSALRVRKP